MKPDTNTVLTMSSWARACQSLLRRSRTVVPT